MMTAPNLTLLFVSVVFSLGAALVWMMWEWEQRTERMRLAQQRSRIDRLH